jgi:hypothetical protein
MQSRCSTVVCARGSPRRGPHTLTVRECHRLVMIRLMALPKIVSPLVRIAERDGVELVLTTVEAWPDEVVVRLRGAPSERTSRLDMDFHRSLDTWHREHQTDPQPQPAEHVFEFDVIVADNVGTVYIRRSSARGGSGTMFRASWTFAPGPPETADYLTVRVGRPHGGEVRIDLWSSE